MSRLIDADKLIERIEEITTTDMMKVLVEDWVNSQPTAYDVDKVVVKIQAQAEMQLQRGIQENEPACLYASSCYAKAAEIVEKGGINERNI